MQSILKKYLQNIYKNVIIKNLKYLFKNKIYFLVGLFIFIKSIIFIGMIGTSKATGINISKGFFSVPPYLVYISFVVLILSFSFLFKGRKHLYSLIVIDILITILFIGDVWYFRGFSGFLNLFLFSQTSNLDNLSSSILSMFRPIDFIYIVDIILLIAYSIFNRELYVGVKRNIILFLATLIIPSLYMTYYYYKVDVYKRCFYGQTAFIQSWAPTQTISNLGPIGYHIFDGYKYYINTRPYHLSDSEKQEITQWYDKKVENLPDNQYAGMFKGKNLIVIQVESLENFVINEKINGQEITPNLNKLLKNSLYFNNYRENVYNGTSSDSDLLTNAGVYPVREGSMFFRYPNNQYKASLPKLLEGMGYSTTAIHPDKGSYWNWMQALTAIGFQKCIDSESFNSTEPIGLGLSDHQYFEQSIAMLEKEKTPSYTFMVTLSSHAPFDLPEKYKELKLDADFDKNILGGYFQSIRYTDTQIGKFIDNLDKKGMLKNTVIAIYGDHTGVHKFYPDKVDEIKPAESWWQNNEMRIPLIIYNPDAKGEVISTQAGQIDFLPTISYLMGVDNRLYEKSALGKVIVNTKRDYTILEDFKMYGKYTSEDEKLMKDGILLSNKMVQSNYFKGGGQN